MKNLMSKFMAIVMLMMIGLGSMSCTTVDGGEEVVFVKKPVFFGFEGVVPEPLTEGLAWVAPTTDFYTYDVKPVQYTEQFDNLITSDNNPVDFKVYFELAIIPGTSPQIHKKFGEQWYKRKVKEKARTYVRNFGRSKTMFELTTDASVTLAMAEAVQDSVKAYLKREEITARLTRVNVGKVIPPAEVIEETIKTAAQIQRRKTEAERAETELSRKYAEENKALADKAYMQKSGMSIDQYLTLRSLEIEMEKIDMVKNKENVSVIMNSGSNGATPMFNAGR